MKQKTKNLFCSVVSVTLWQEAVIPVKGNHKKQSFEKSMFPLNKEEELWYIWLISPRAENDS